MNRGFLVIVLSMTVAIPTAKADLLWYNGNFNGRGGMGNGLNMQFPDYRVYENFTLTSNSIIQEVFSNNLMSSAFSTTAYWEIRSGVSSGNGGTLLYSGTNASTPIATGRSGFGRTEYTVSVNGLNLFLEAGTYWLAVAPIGTGLEIQDSFLSTTSGASSFGLIPGGAYVDAPSDSLNFADTASFGDIWVNFSMGVNGIAVPVPSGVILGTVAMLCLIASNFYRQRQHASSV